VESLTNRSRQSISDRWNRNACFQLQRGWEVRLRHPSRMRRAIDEQLSLETIV